jgi:general secretion pathway protein D
MRTNYVDRALAVPLVLMLLGACQTTPPVSTPQTRTVPHQSTTRVSQVTPKPAGAAAAPAAQEDSYRIYKGTGVVVKGQLPGGGVPPSQVVQQAGGSVVLNFEGADLREVIRNILGDILNESYMIDAAVGGQVTIRTTGGIPRESLYATLETLLRMNGATMVKEGNAYKIVPQAAAVRGNVTPQLGSSQRALPPGFSVQIVPLRYVGVREMVRILEPFAKDAQAVRADEIRNLLILSGTERELKHLVETIDMFDIDWMSGMSAGVFTLQNADVKSVMAELDKLIGPVQQSPLAGILRIVPIERMNALLVVSPNPQYLEEAKKWIERLDRGGAGDAPRLFVYHMQNSRAEKVAPLLQQAFTGRAQQATTVAPPTVAPGTPAGTIVSPPSFAPQQPTPPGTPPTPPQQTAAAVAAGAAAGVTAARAAADGTGIIRNLQAVADKDNNTILIVATPAEYAVIESALKRLDVPARQVVIEMAIAEIVLTDRIQFGVEWLFTADNGDIIGGNLTSPIQPGAGGGGTTISGLLSQGFSAILRNAAFPGGIQAALRLLDNYGNTKVISNPHLSAVDNQKATIKVGDRIPICTETVVPGTVVSNTVQTTSSYIDTGVLVQVTPHINAGGLVTLEVQAEVSTPGPTPGLRTCESPPINTRSVQTFVSVPSGDTMVMGGLINDRAANTSSGLPFLSRIPYVGGLFGQQTINKDRTELVLFITPRVVETPFDTRSVIEDLRRKMERLETAFPISPVTGAPTVPPAPSTIVAPR